MKASTNNEKNIHYLAVNTTIDYINKWNYWQDCEQKRALSAYSVAHHTITTIFNGNDMECHDVVIPDQKILIDLIHVYREQHEEDYYRHEEHSEYYYSTDCSGPSKL